jgi:signal peptidase I
MAPTLLPGDWALAVSVRRPKRGDIVVVEHPDRPGYEMVKRVGAVPGEVVARTNPDGTSIAQVLARDEFWVLGDHEPASTDSRHFGPVGLDGLKARVILVYWPTERRTLLDRKVATTPDV